MSLARSTPREATLRDDRERTESTGPIPTEMAKTAVLSSLHEMGGNECSDIQHPERLRSNVEAANGYLTKATVEPPRKKPIWPFLTMPYLLAQITQRTARTVQVFYMQSIHIARHAVTLVTLLNETVEEEEGPTDEQRDERIKLESELTDLDKAMKKWGAKDGVVDEHGERVEEIRRQYDRFFGEQFYHPDARNYQFLAKVVAYDDRTMECYTSKESHTSESSSSSASHQPLPAPPINENFDLLVSILTRLRDEENPRPYTSAVDAKMTPQSQRIYERAGVTSFKEYATYAKRMGIIRLGGNSDGPGNEWMELVATD